MVLPAGHGRGVIVQNEDRRRDLVISHIENAAHAAVKEGGITYHRHDLAMFLRQNSLNTNSLVYTRSHADCGVYGRQWRGYGKGVAAYITSDKRLFPVEDVEYPSMGAADTHHRRTKGNILRDCCTCVCGAGCGQEG